MQFDTICQVDRWRSLLQDKYNFILFFRLSLSKLRSIDANIVFNYLGNLTQSTVVTQFPVLQATRAHKINVPIDLSCNSQPIAQRIGNITIGGHIRNRVSKINGEGAMDAIHELMCEGNVTVNSVEMSPIAVNCGSI